MPETPFQAYSCATVMAFSFAKSAQELPGFDNANFVHWSAMPEGVGEGIGSAARLVAWDDLKGSVALIDCLFIALIEAAFALFGTGPSFAYPPGGLKQIESPTMRLEQSLFILRLQEASLLVLSFCVLRIDWQVSPCLNSMSYNLEGDTCDSQSTNLLYVGKATYRSASITKFEQSAYRLFRICKVPVETPIVSEIDLQVSPLATV